MKLVKGKVSFLIKLAAFQASGGADLQELFGKIRRIENIF
jgi:hypothetical protein